MNFKKLTMVAMIVTGLNAGQCKTYTGYGDLAIKAAMRANEDANYIKLEKQLNLALSNYIVAWDACSGYDKTRAKGKAVRVYNLMKQSGVSQSARVQKFIKAAR